MIAIISPAKTLDFNDQRIIGKTSLPYFIQSAEEINSKLKKLSRTKLEELQSISPQLASVNYQRNQDWNTDHSYGTRQAALCFKGDVYQGMEAEEWTESDMAYAAKHLFILSGLYGLLKPTDLIKPYRLEMGTSLPIGRKKDLYHFWSDRMANYFEANIDRSELIVNLASNEYFKALKAARVKNPVLDVEFKDFSNGSYKVISFFAKKARGMMASHIIKNRIEKPEALKAFNSESYYFDIKSSTADKFVFLRDKK
jgi:cytoplasmic iron level regulating protein YaaA (DUF328/UPF0246 family)